MYTIVAGKTIHAVFTLYLFFWAKHLKLSTLRQAQMKMYFDIQMFLLKL